LELQGCLINLAFPNSLPWKALFSGKNDDFSLQPSFFTQFAIISNRHNC
jgi:hypothetical protein